MEPNTSNDSPTEEALVENEATETEVGEEKETPSNLEEALAEIDRLEAKLEAAKAPKPKKKKKPLTSDEQFVVDTHLTPSEAALSLNVDPRVLRKAIRNDRVNAVKVQGRWYLSQEEIDRVKAFSEAGTKAEAEKTMEEEITQRKAEAEKEAHETLVEAIKEFSSI